MKFEAREIKPYAEPLSHEDLCEGQTYFFVHFLDDDMLVPTLEPVVFIGRNLEPGEIGQVWFQDYESYRGGTRQGQTNAENGCFYTGAQEEIGHVFEYEQALNQLMLCSLRRKDLP